MNFKITIVGFILLTVNAMAGKPTLHFSQVAHAALPTCNEAPSVAINKVEVANGIKGIPTGLLVAREARFYVESKSQNGKVTRIESFQSFLNSKKTNGSKVICGSSEEPTQNRFSMMGPTLIHNQVGQKSQNIFWQFQVLAEKEYLTSWNTRSIALRSSEDLEKTLQKLGYEAKVYQLSTKKFEIVYSQSLADKKQILSVTYDLD